MDKETFVAAMLASLLLVSFVGIPSAEVAKANFAPPPPELPPIYTRENGSVESSDAPIKSAGSSYVLTDNITGYCIRVQRSNMVIVYSGLLLEEKS